MFFNPYLEPFVWTAWWSKLWWCLLIKSFSHGEERPRLQLRASNQIAGCIT